jgi:hypothetical protein
MSDGPLSTIAVVAVHGIGDQPPRSSARSIADLLLRLRIGSGENSLYTTFGERPIRVPVRPARVGDGPGPYPHEHAFMREQLIDYQSTAEPYETIRLDGQRLVEDNAGSLVPQADIHVYEMYWADLSRFRGRVLSVFAELYQLFFHVAHLGALAIDHALVEHKTSALWRAFRGFHGIAVHMLTVLVPTLFLTVLATVMGLMVLGVPATLKPALFAGLVGVGTLAGGGVLSYRGGLHRSAAAWVAVPILAIVGAAFAWRFAVLETHDVHLDRALIMSWVALSGVGLWVVYRAYDRRRPTAFRFGMGAYALFAILTTALVVTASHTSAIYNALINVFEIEMFGAILVWAGFYFAGASSGVLGWLVSKPLAAEARDRAKRVAWTARATLAISATSVLLVSFVMWSALLAAFGSRLPREQPTLLFDLFGPAWTYAGVFDNAISVTAGPGTPIVVLFVVVLAIAGLIALVPAAIREARPSHVGHSFKQRAHNGAAGSDAEWQRQSTDDAASERLGWWLTTGLGVTGVLMTMQFVALFYILPLANIAHFVTQGSIETFYAMQRSASEWILRAGALVVGVQVGAVALSGWAGANALGFRTMLDALLDVDSYLRRHPRDDTPRARIAERFASLMRYLSHWRGEKYGYKAIIFVTHSQGTVITADMLNYLQCEEDDELTYLRTQARGEPPAWTMKRQYLFTVGSPLRDLYSFAFPHLYGWVRGEHPPTGASRGSGFARNVSRTLEEHAGLGQRVAAPAIGLRAAPDPFDLGVARWVNAYRSGDYVGRSLWRAAMPEVGDWWLRSAPADARTRHPDDVAPVIYASEDAVGSRREVCIGAGAHTHYWDETAKAVALELDALIDGALAQPVYPTPAAKSFALEAER